MAAFSLLHTAPDVHRSDAVVEGDARTIYMDACLRERLMRAREPSISISTIYVPLEFYLTQPETFPSGIFILNHRFTSLSSETVEPNYIRCQNYSDRFGHYIYTINILIP